LIDKTYGFLESEANIKMLTDTQMDGHMHKHTNIINT